MSSTYCDLVVFHSLRPFAAVGFFFLRCFWEQDQATGERLLCCVLGLQQHNVHSHSADLRVFSNFFKLRKEALQEGLFCHVYLSCRFIGESYSLDPCAMG